MTETEEVDVEQTAEQTTRKIEKRPGPKWESASKDRIKAALKKYSKALTGLIEMDANEADTRLFITDFLFDALGYDKYTDLCTEYRVKNEYVDYGIRIDKDLIALVEVKRMNTKLGAKHLRQAQSYAVNEGVEWIILTNGAQWQVYHLTGGLPVITDLVLAVDLAGDGSVSQKANQMYFLSREAMKRGKMGELWHTKRATSPKSLSSILLSDPVVAALRKELKRVTGYSVDLIEVRRLIKDTCIREECLC